MNKFLISLAALCALAFFNACSNSDDEMDPGTGPQKMLVKDLRLSQFSLVNGSMVDLVGRVSYDAENRVDSILVKDESKESNDQYIFSYSGNTATVDFYEVNDSDMLLTLSILHRFDENDLLIEQYVKDYDGLEIERETEKTYSYDSGKLVSFNYLITRLLSGNMGRNEAGTVSYADDKLDKVIVKTTDPNVCYIDSTQFQFDGELFSSSSSFRSSPCGSEFDIRTEVDFIYADSLLTAFNVRSYDYDFTQDPAVITLQSEELVESYRYNDEGLISSQIFEDGYDLVYEYEEGEGNIAKFNFFANGEVPHATILGLVPNPQ